jgi:hypothetical protein
MSNPSNRKYKADELAQFCMTTRPVAVPAPVKQTYREIARAIPSPSKVVPVANMVYGTLEVVPSIAYLAKRLGISPAATSDLVACGDLPLLERDSLGRMFFLKDLIDKFRAEIIKAKTKKINDMGLSGGEAKRVWDIITNG